MKLTTIILQLLLAVSLNGQVDKVCRVYCQTIVVEGGVVKFLDETPPAPRKLDMGSYLAEVQAKVPRAEAPIRELNSSTGWKIIATAFIHHESDNAGMPGVRLRFFDPRGVEQATDDLLEILDEAQIGQLFGGDDQIFAAMSEEEHAYNVETKLWLLPDRGKPKRLLRIRGALGSFAAGDLASGVTIARQTYDGEHAGTKGTIREFFSWNRKAKALTLRAN